MDVALLVPAEDQREHTGDVKHDHFETESSLVCTEKMYHSCIFVQREADSPVRQQEAVLVLQQRIQQVFLGLPVSKEPVEFSGAYGRVGLVVAAVQQAMVNEAVKDVPGVTDAAIELVFEPEWDRSRMSEEALVELGWL